MRKTFLVVALAAVMIFAFSAAAFADHAPNFYIAWDDAGVNSNGPHTDYQLTTEKCSVCHAVHRAAVPGESWTSAPAQPSDWAVPVGAPDTQMLLRSNVANACNYCHIQTATGGVRLYNGNVINFGGDAGWTASGYAHNTGCTGCHAVHGAKTFKGAIASKILRYDIKAAVVTGSGAEHTYTDPVTGIAQKSGIVDEIWSNNGQNAGVALGSVAMFTGGTIAGPIEGVGARADLTNVKQAQGTAFCTSCHSNYSSSSETTVNIDRDVALFQGSPFGSYAFPGYAWADAAYGTYTHKNHPVGPATNAFAAAGDTTAVTRVAWADSSYCRSCHDAGEVDSAAGVIENSYPHFTPGYFKFMGAGANASYAAGPNADDYADGLDVSTETPSDFGGSAAALTAPKAADGIDGHCLKCHVNATGTEGVGLTF